MQINQANLNDLYKTFQVLYVEAYQGGPVARPQFTTQIPAATMEVFLKWLGAVPNMEKFMGELALQNLASHGFNTNLEKFAMGVGIPDEDIENDQYGTYNPMFSAMGMAAAEHPDELLANTMLGGFTSLCYTGKNFFDVNHAPVANGAKFTNKHTYALSSNSFQDARANIKNRQNAKGRPMNLGRKLTLVVSPSNETLGRQILLADFVLQAGAANNAAAAAVTNVNKGTADLFVWPLLSAQPTAWFLLELGLPIKPFSYLENKKTTFSSLTAPTSDAVFHKHQFEYQAYGRYNTGYLLPELAEGSTGTTAAL